MLKKKTIQWEIVWFLVLYAFILYVLIWNKQKEGCLFLFCPYFASAYPTAASLTARRFPTHSFWFSIMIPILLNSFHRSGSIPNQSFITLHTADWLQRILLLSKDSSVYLHIRFTHTNPHTHTHTHRLIFYTQIH